MFRFCHRCAEELPSGAAQAVFCPHCGAPQLYLQEQQKEQQQEHGSILLETAAPTGAPPPPLPRAVDWKAAMVCGAAVAGMAALLSVASAGFPAVTVLNWLWILSASMTTLALYQKRRPLAAMNGRIGARIGLMTGLTLVAFIGVAMAIAGLMARFVLHSMSGFDAKLAEQMHLQMDHALATNPPPKEMFSFFYSPEFSAGMMLTGIAMVAVIVIVLSAISGAAGGAMRTRQARAA